MNTPKKVILTNFQKHASLEVELTNGINVLWGPSGSGKSCVVRALRWLYFNDISTNAVRREGSKETSVKVIDSDGVEVERIKTNTVNAYVLRKDGEEKRYDSVGKSIPEDIKNYFGLNTITVDKTELNLNVSGQFDSSFLLGKEFSPAFRAKLFNYLTGNELSDILFKEMNKDMLALSRKEKSEEEEIAGLTEKEKVLTSKLQEKEQDFAFKFKSLNKIKAKFALYNTYVSLHQRLTTSKEELTGAETALAAIHPIDGNKLKELEKLLIKYDTLKNLDKRLFKARTQLEGVEAQLKGIKPVAVNYGVLRGIVERHDTLVTLETRYKRVTTALKEAEDELAAKKSISLDYEGLKAKINLYNKLCGLELRWNTIQENLEIAEKELVEKKKEYKVGEAAYKKMYSELKLCGNCPFIKEEK